MSGEPQLIPEIKYFVMPEPFKISEELQATIDTVIHDIGEQSFSGRHPELGKMVNCQICGTRHRANERKCEQVFTYRIGDYELLKENEAGELVPDYRTAIRESEKPTTKQVMGRAAFAKKRLHPHPSKMKLLFILRTREAFVKLGFSTEENKEVFEKNLQRARVVAARLIRKDRELQDREVRRRQDRSRRINRGLYAR